MEYTHTHSEVPYTQLRLASIAVTFLAFLTGLIYLQVALTNDGENGVGRETAILLIIGLLGLLFAWKWLAVGGLIGIIAGVGVAAFAYISSASNQLFAAVLYGSPFIVAGGLRIACWYKTER
jgi:hypothetical protein